MYAAGFDEHNVTNNSFFLAFFGKCVATKPTCLTKKQIPKRKNCYEDV